MGNVTISLDEELIKSSRAYAAKKNISLNAMIRNMLKKTTNPSVNWLDNYFEVVDQINLNSNLQPEIWKREELYDV